MPVGGKRSASSSSVRRRRSPSTRIDPSPPHSTPCQRSGRPAGLKETLLVIGASALLFLVAVSVFHRTSAAARQRSRTEEDLVENSNRGGDRSRPGVAHVMPSSSSSKVESTSNNDPESLPIRYELVKDGTHRSGGGGAAAASSYRKYRAVRRDDRSNSYENPSVSFGEWARGLSQPHNAAALTEAIVGSSGQNKGDDGRYGAVFWETPSVRPSTLETQPMEFVLVDAPMLERFAKVADPAPFEEHFRACAEEAVGCVFESLGRDAVLISPKPFVAAASKNSNSVNAAHLMAYLQTAPAEQSNALWKTVGETYLDALQPHHGKSGVDAPRWLSTSGLGVPYLHVRIDRRPKYYTHDPYKQAG